MKDAGWYGSVTSLYTFLKNRIFCLHRCLYRLIIHSWKVSYFMQSFIYIYIYIAYMCYMQTYTCVKQSLSWNENAIAQDLTAECALEGL